MLVVAVTNQNLSISRGKEIYLICSGPRGVMCRASLLIACMEAGDVYAKLHSVEITHSDVREMYLSKMLEQAVNCAHMYASDYQVSVPVRLEVFSSLSLELYEKLGFKVVTTPVGDNKSLELVCQPQTY